MDEIRAPRGEERELLVTFFKRVIEDTIEKEEIEVPYFLEEEVGDKMELLGKYLTGEDEERIFLVAWYRGRILGTISYAPCNEYVVELLGEDLEDTGEIGTVYVDPGYQGQGIGSALFNAMCIELLERRIESFYLDSGYRRAQRYWTRKLGDPIRVAKDYWDKGADHMIWYKKIGGSTSQGRL